MRPQSLRRRALVGAVLAGLCYAAADASDRDARLERKVTLSVEKATLSRALRELGRSGKVPLVSGAGYLASRPVLIFTHQEPLGTVMDHVARFTALPESKNVWERVSANGQNGYRLTEDLRSERQRTLLIRRLRNERRQRLIGDVNTGLRLAQLEEEALKQERKRHPELVSWMPMLRPHFGLLASLNARQREDLLSGKLVELPYRDLPKDQQQQLHQIVGNGGATGSLPGYPDLMIEWRADRDLPKSRLTLRLSGPPDRPGILSVIPAFPGARMGHPELLHPGLISANPAELPPWLREVVAERKAEADRQRAKREKEARKDPQLLKKITVRSRVPVPDPRNPGKSMLVAADLSQVLAQVAKESGLSLIGDYDPVWDDYYSWNDKDQPGRDVSAGGWIRT